ncbi:putative cyclin-dependent kinase regulatory subunit CKS1 [Monocercomonoides exilis]|uniref:putative cyclin-dependent kinase regulatory subunit CKS1 n=1 Tax=Monocercomonoides exilis TaxID=2049356 RepID=UPI00355A8230|nr:putative cyclin-dependent kinase regulatory subunit CKS1 [Monocercomonoides exilis]
MAHRQERRPEDEIFYSEKVCDDMYEYRHVILPKEIAAKVPKDRLMSEEEWRSIGIQQSQGWLTLIVMHLSLI